MTEPQKLYLSSATIDALRRQFAQEWHDLRRAIVVLHRAGEYFGASVLRQRLHEVEQVFPLVKRVRVRTVAEIQLQLAAEDHDS